MTRKKKPTTSLVRSSAAEYLTFVAASGAGGVEAVYADENVWLSQKMMAQLYDDEVPTIESRFKLEAVPAAEFRMIDDVFHCLHGRDLDRLHGVLVKAGPLGSRPNEVGGNVKPSCGDGYVELKASFRHQLILIRHQEILT